MQVQNQLRTWSAGDYPLEAATELLLRGFGGRFADTSRGWIMRDRMGRYVVDFASIPAGISSLTEGEQGFLRIASSLGEGGPVQLSEVLPGMDPRNIMLILAAVAHAAGTHADTDFRVDQEGRMHVGADPSLYPWPNPQQRDL